MNAHPLNSESQQVSTPEPATLSTDCPKPIFRPLAVWEGIRAEYVQGLFSTRALAKRHGISLNTLQARCNREGWVEDRACHLEMAFEDRLSGDEPGQFA